MHNFFTLFRYHTSTCFGSICSQSSGGRVYHVVYGTSFTVRSVNLKLLRCLHIITKYMVVVKICRYITHVRTIVNLNNYIL
jgi:hypothetical protein